MTSGAKLPNPPESAIHKLVSQISDADFDRPPPFGGRCGSQSLLFLQATDIEKKAEYIFNALRTQPGFELRILNWARDNDLNGRNGGVRIGDGAAVEAGNGSPPPWAAPPSDGANTGVEATTIAPPRRAASVYRGPRRGGHARSVVSVGEENRRTGIEISDGKNSSSFREQLLPLVQKCLPI